MIIFRQTRRYGFYIFWFLLMFLTVSCSSPEQPESNFNQIPPTPVSGQPVEYGASLSEWEEATQTESDVSVDLAETSESSGYPVPDSPQIAVASEPEAVQPEDGYPGVAVPTATAEVTVDNAATTTEVAVDIAATEEPTTTTLFALDDIVYQEIMWDALVPTNFTPAAIMAKYQDQLAQFEDGSPEANDLYMQMQAEFNKAPVNETMDGVLVRLPGFIAPLEYTDNLITEFLLVPYFGACIHVPPPPANQTVLVKLSEGQGIKFEDSYNPIWVMGQLTAEGATTDLAEAGYYMEDAIFELYSSES